jgi:cell division protease FtsH
VSHRDRRVPPLALPLLSVLVLLLAGAAGFASLAPDPPGPAIGLDAVLGAATDGEVTEAVLLDHDAVVVVERADGTVAHATYPGSDAATAQLVADLAAGGAAVRVDPQVGKAVVSVLVTVVLPLVLLAALFAVVLVATRDGGGGGGVLGLGRLRGRTADGADRPAVRFDDVAGIDDAVVELREVVEHLRDPSRLAALGARPPTGVLLAGPPGVGKTLVARAVAGEAGVPFFHVAGAEFVESLVGVGAARVRDLFAQVRAVAPAIVFVDEVDAVGRRRGAGGAVGGTDEREQTLNQLLVELDGFSVDDGIVVLAATNRPDILDPALLRPGRFDRHVEIARPDRRARVAILSLHAATRPLGPDVDLEALAQRTPGFTGADLAAVVNEAAILTARSGEATVTHAHLVDAVERVRSGPRASQLLRPEERRRVAVHESGRAVVHAALGRADEVTRVTAVPRGRSVALAGVGGDEALRDRDQLRDDLAALLAGTLAERRVLGAGSSLGESALTRATELARQLVGAHALTDGLPLRRLLAPSTGGHLGDAPPDAVLGAEVRERFDAAVDAELRLAEERASAALEEHRAVLDDLVEDLEATETLDGHELHRRLLVVTVSGPDRRVATAAARTP